MRGDAGPRLEVEVRSDGVVRIHVLFLHEPARLVRTNRQQREVDKRNRPAATPGEDPDIAGIVPGPQPPQTDD